MKQKTSIFQIIIIIVFFILALLGFFVFSQFENDSKENIIKVGNVIIWGIVDKDIINSVLKNLTNEKEEFRDVVYVQKDERSFNREFTESLALDIPPDLVILSNENLYENLNKIQLIPYNLFRKRAYLSTFVDASSIFLQKDGISGIPFLIDPLVMYYNKSIFKSDGITQPPKYWSDFSNLSKKITKIDDDDNIIRSTVAFGETENINNFKEILLTLFFQLGNKIIIEDDNIYKTINWDVDNLNPSSGLEFFTEFSVPKSQLYSWNRTLPTSIDFFNSGKLAIYFGFASDARRIRHRNPNLYFDVAEIPAIKNVQNNVSVINKTTYAKMFSMSIPNNNNVNVNGAFNVALELSKEKTQRFLSDKLFLPPIRNDLLSESPEDIYMDIFYKEAIYAYSFLDPNYTETNDIFKYMVNSVKIGRESFFSAVLLAINEIDTLLKR